MKDKVKKVMHEFKEGTLHSGGKKGPVVKNPKQAIAIAMSEAGMNKKYAHGGKMKGLSAPKDMPMPAMMHAASKMMGSAPNYNVNSTGAPPMPRYNARALRSGGMANGGPVGCPVRGDGAVTRGHTKGKIA